VTLARKYPRKKWRTLARKSLGCRRKKRQEERSM